MRIIGVISVSRSDYGIYRPILRQISATPGLRLELFVSGMHLSPEFGRTIDEILHDGFHVAHQIEMLVSSDTPQAIAKSMAVGTMGFAQAFSTSRPDILLTLGDRFEMHSAVVAALPFRIPIAHIHGGETTEGLIDEAIRHSITKMSHLHFAATEEYGQRIIQMGEEPWRVVVTGAPSLDNLRSIQLLSRDELTRCHNLTLEEQSLLVTYHPVTLEHEKTGEHLGALLSALEATGMYCIFTYPNADTEGRRVIEMVHHFAESYGRAQIVTNLGTRSYFSLLAHVTAMVGNSSSGIVEAATFRLPVVNVGNRQRGRLHGKNVIDVGNDKEEIFEAIRRATSVEFRGSLAELENPYGRGAASEAIVNSLARVDLERLVWKRFHRIRGTET